MQENAQQQFLDMVKLAVRDGRLAEHADQLTAIIMQQPDHPAFGRYYGLLCRQQGRMADITNWLAAIEADGRVSANSLTERAAIAAMQSNIGLADDLAAQAFALDESRDDALTIRAKVALYQRDYVRADELFRAALALDPDNLDAAYHHASSLQQQKRMAPAIAMLEHCLALRPGHPQVCNVLEYCYRRTANWGRTAALEPVVREQTRAAIAAGGVPAELPFHALIRYGDDHYVRDVGAAFARTLGPAVPRAAAPVPPPDANKRLRIGYLSGHFYDHPNMHLIAGMFGHHDRENFEIVGITYGPERTGPERQKIVEQTDAFIDFGHADNVNALQQVKAAGIDILVDLRGFTESSRINLCRQRAAPVTVTWLGYPGPMPPDVVDYQLVDPIIAPEQDRDAFGCALAVLPSTYQMTDNTQPVGAPITRAEVLPGLDAETFVFGCFCQPYKIEPELFAVWMEILQAVPRSILWLWADDDLTRGNLRAVAVAGGIDPARLVFAPMMQKQQHLARVQHADLILDTWNYGGHVTTTDMLWAGVPVLAKRGTHFASRVSQSLLHAAGLPDMVADDADGYRDKAIALANDPAALAAIRERVVAARTGSALFDTPGRVRHLEQLYPAMWQRYVAGEAPADIHLS